MDKELLKEAERIWDRQTKAQKFETRFGVYPFAEGKELVAELRYAAQPVQRVLAILEAICNKNFSSLSKLQI